MKINLNCPYAKHNNKMRVICMKTQDLCGHQYFKTCKGWCELTDTAAKCPLRKEKP